MELPINFMSLGRGSVTSYIRFLFTNQMKGYNICDKGNIVLYKIIG